MIIKKILLLFLVLPSWLSSNQLDTTTLFDTHTLSANENSLTVPVTRKPPENRSFENMRVYNTTHASTLFIQDNLIIGGNLKVNGDTIGGIGTLNGPNTATPNAAPRFANTTGNTIVNSPVIIDDAGNVSGVNTLTATQINAHLNGTTSNVLSVGGESAAHVAAATNLLSNATHDNSYSTIVKRDNTGSFVTTMITLTGVVTNETDLTTKAYVDALSTSDFLAKAPVQAASTNIISLSGPQTIDGVLLVATDRVLLVGQADPVDNGLWVVQAGAWTRPLDFISPPEVGRAYVLVLDGNTLGGTSWLCVSPDAAIDTDPLSFIEYTLSGETTGNNVGNDTGTIFKDITGNYIHFKSLVAGTHTTVTNNLLPDNSDITITLTGYSDNTPNTLVLRDSSNNFSAGTITAALTGTASENVLRSGDTMTGKLTLPAGTTAAPSLRFADSTNTGISTPTPNKLSLSTNGAQRMSIDAVGTVTINQFSGSAGVVHANNFGALASLLVVDADIDAATTIQDTKLATISSPDKILDFATSATSLPINNTIVRRDSNGDFQANIITANRISGGLAGYVLRSGDSMTGTFTVVAGSTAQPSLAFAGGTNTGLSAQTPNTLVMSTNGVEHMSINETGTVTIPGTLVLAPGSIAQPSLQFANSTNTGISSPTPDRISFDVNGIERLSIDANGVHALTTAFVINNVMSLISTQSLNITDFGTYPITINNDTSLLIVTYVVGVPITVDITFPNNPYEGQLLTIKAILIPTPPVYSNNLNLTYNYTFNPATEEVLLLNPTLALNTEFNVPNRGTGGAAVTYIYHTAATGFPQDGWYRYGRG